ncbi:MAG: hypothetical protein PHN45_02180 [Methylococcales bacterium]|nr:hypothetical protein [Methylococcales bacterium]
MAQEYVPETDEKKQFKPHRIPTGSRIYFDRQVEFLLEHIRGGHIGEPGVCYTIEWPLPPDNVYFKSPRRMMVIAVCWCEKHERWETGPKSEQYDYYADTQTVSGEYRKHYDGVHDLMLRELQKKPCWGAGAEKNKSIV